MSWIDETLILILCVQYIPTFCDDPRNSVSNFKVHLTVLLVVYAQPV